jgi:hypothetical protein
MLGVDLVGSRRIWPAQVGFPVGPDGSRRIQKDRLDDRLDDHRDDQGASDKKSDGRTSEPALRAEAERMRTISSRPRVAGVRGPFTLCFFAQRIAVAVTVCRKAA